MKDFEKNVLNELLNKYERSKLSKDPTINRSIKLTTKDKVLKTYTSVDSYLYASANDEILLKLQELGFITTFYNNETFDYLTLNINKVDDIYLYLGRDNPLDELTKIKEVLSKYQFNNYMDDFIYDVNNYIDNKHEYPKKYFNDSVQLDLLLKTINCLFNLDKDYKKRDFSVKYLNDSKLFESIENKVIKIIKDYDVMKYNSDEDLLASYGIYHNPTYVILKNKLVFKINQQVIDLNSFNYEFHLSDDMINDLEIFDCNLSKVITVENLTTFYEINDKEALIIYLAGFHNHTKQLLLKKIYNKYPNIDYYHFSDIDVGGFLIYNNLKEKTNIDFKPYRMNIDELKNNKNHLKSLTDNDIKRLNMLLLDSKYQIFYDTIKYMLENNVKLEQEILDKGEMK